MKNMSFAKTIEQFRNGTKDVTRRLGWSDLNPGVHYTAIEKGQGLKKGEHVVPLGQCICISNYQEPVSAIVDMPIRFDPVHNPLKKREVEREGFPELTEEEFVDMFCKFNTTPKRKCTPDTMINRIMFGRYVA
jgi:hypothetical protein